MIGDRDSVLVASTEFAVAAACATGPELERVVLDHLCAAAGADRGVLYVLSAQDPAVLRPAATRGVPLAPFPLELADIDGSQLILLRAGAAVVGGAWLAGPDGALLGAGEPLVANIAALGAALLQREAGSSEAEGWRRELDELRTPLTTITGFCGLLGETGAPRADWVHAVSDSAAELLVRLELLEQRCGVVRR